MGYRSNGKLWLSLKAQEKVTDELKKDLEINWKKESDNIWSFEEWKWYPTYQDIKNWENFMKLCDKEELDYEFVRIGEDLDDNEIRGTDPYSIFGISRNIDIY